NHENGTLWVAPHVTKGYKQWIKGSNNRRVLMDISPWGDYMKGRHDFSYKKTYLESYLIAMKKILDQNPAVEGFYIKNLVKTMDSKEKETGFGDIWTDKMESFLPEIVE